MPFLEKLLRTAQRAQPALTGLAASLPKASVITPRLSLAARVAVRSANPNTTTATRFRMPSMPSSYTPRMLKPLVEAASADEAPSLLSLAKRVFQHPITWGVGTLAAGGGLTYLASQFDDRGAMIVPLSLGHAGYDAEGYKRLRLSEGSLATIYLDSLGRNQLKALENAIEEVIHTGSLTFRVKKIVDGIEFIEPLTRHEKPENFKQLRYNIDYFRDYISQYMSLLQAEEPEVQRAAIENIVDKCARNGLYSFLELLADEFNAADLIDKNPLARRVLKHPSRQFIEDVVSNQRVYYIRPESAQANVWLFLQMMRAQAIAKTTDKTLEAEAFDEMADGFVDSDSGLYKGLHYLFKQLAATREVDEKFKYVAVIDADKPEDQLDLYYETLKAESKKRGKPVTGICMLGAAHFTVNYITVDASKKSVSHLYIDSFGAQKGTEPDTTFYPSLVRTFELNPDDKYKVESMLSKFTTQRGSSMGCSVHACFYLAILLEIGEWLGERYPALKEVPVNERLFVYCRETDKDGPVEARTSYRTRQEIAEGDYNHWHILPRYIHFVRPPYPFLITGQSLCGKSTVNPEVNIYYTADPHEWNYEQDPVECEREIVEQHGVKTQVRRLVQESSPCLAELSAPFPHLGYRSGYNFYELLERFIVRNSKGSERSHAIETFAQDMREALVPYLLNASWPELRKLQRKLDDKGAKLSAAAMAKRLGHPTSLYRKKEDLSDTANPDEQPGSSLYTQATWKC